jgi:hypothetical protein
LKPARTTDPVDALILKAYARRSGDQIDRIMSVANATGLSDERVLEGLVRATSDHPA